MYLYGGSNPQYHEDTRLRGRIDAGTVRRVLRWIDNGQTDPWFIYKITQVG